MSSLREVKDRIASVRSTLKITSAMKLVASSKLLKTQRAIEALRPYEEALGRILAAVQGDSSASLRMTASRGDSPAAPHILLAFSSNTSMCGAFNANAISAALSEAGRLQQPLSVWAFGRKMAQSLSKAGVTVARDFSQLVGKPDFDAAAAISSELRELYAGGSIGGATLVYNHFVSTGRQQVVVEPFLGQSEVPAADSLPDDSDLCSAADYIFEPSRPQLLTSLLPQVLDLRLYAALLDSIAAEHAARMVAMQTATDNARDLLDSLVLEYNKGRQQKITAEILDLVGAEAAA